MGKSNYSDDLRTELDAASRRVAGELQSLNDSGATTTDDKQRAYDAFIANLPDDARARYIAEAEDARDQIEAMLTNSGYRGDIGSMNLIDLANLAATAGSSRWKAPPRSRLHRRSTQPMPRRRPAAAFT